VLLRSPQSVTSESESNVRSARDTDGHTETPFRVAGGLCPIALTPGCVRQAVRHSATEHGTTIGSGQGVPDRGLVMTDGEAEYTQTGSAWIKADRVISDAKDLRPVLLSHEREFNACFITEGQRGDLHW
jgi:hypothetical protein